MGELFVRLAFPFFAVLFGIVMALAFFIHAMTLLAPQPRLQPIPVKPRRHRPF
jgi:hypothetical protein